jgi:Rho-binding antiterminator
VSVHLREGEAFIDEVVDVVTEKGEDFAVFKSHERVPVGAILSVTRAQGRARGGEAGRLG